MKTTLELPDVLWQKVRILAAHRQEKLKDIVARLLAAGLQAETAKRPKAPAPVKLRGRGPLTIDDIQSAIDRGRE